MSDNIRKYYETVQTPCVPSLPADTPGPAPASLFCWPSYPGQLLHPFSAGRHPRAAPASPPVKPGISQTAVRDSPGIRIAFI